MKRVLFFGDLFGKPGRQALSLAFPELSETYNPDIVIANVENMAHGKGITRSTIAEVDAIGVFHAYTTGNHFLAKEDVLEVVKDSSIPLIRPFNYPVDMAGVGLRVVTVGAYRMLVINFLGRIFMRQSETFSNPFVDMENILQGYSMDASEDGKEFVDSIFVDFHAETTAEKRNFAFMCDGRVSAVVGTHTHVPTADEQILPEGTAYISDVGMVGPLHSSLGLDKDAMVQEFINEERGPREVSETPEAEVGAVVIDIGEGGRATKIERIRKIVSLS